MALTESSSITWRTLAWAIGPVIGVLLLRAGLQAQGENDASGLQPLRAATLVADPYQAMWAAARPFVFTALGLLVAALLLRWGLRAALRRHGWPRVRPWAVALWVMAWGLGGAWLLTSHLNESGRHAVAEPEARVLLARAVPPGAHSPGGTELYLQLPGTPAPQRLLAEGESPAAWPPGRVARLHVEAGRWWGRWGRLAPPAGG